MIWADRGRNRGTVPLGHGFHSLGGFGDFTGWVCVSLGGFETHFTGWVSGSLGGFQTKFSENF